MVKWIGLLPLAAHFLSTYLCFRIATIPISYWRWRLAWALMTAAALTYAAARVENVVRIVAYDLPFDPWRTLFGTVGAFCMLGSIVTVWRIIKPQATAPVAVPKAETWTGEEPP